jgi:tRNA-splicing ligase RtcB
MTESSALIQKSEFIYEIDPSFREDMRVPARLFANAALLTQILQDRSLWQLVNVATLPGVESMALAMPDIHEGYGFPIGGVAAMAIDEGGVISPGGIGYDINCGVRLLATDLPFLDVQQKLDGVASRIFHTVPSGVGRSGHYQLKPKELNHLLEHGASHLINDGIGEPTDLENCESFGNLADASADLVSDFAKERGKDQLGTLGSGNHFLEIQVVDEIFDEKTAQVFGLKKGNVTAMIHCGSRGLGHQVCTDYVRLMLTANANQISLVDRQLACAPFISSFGQQYFSAMKAAANFAWANRHLIGQKIREAFKHIFGQSTSVRTVYDVAHNIGKVETHAINGVSKKLIVHRKGATRAFPPGHGDLAKKYAAVGQPVLIPGTMGTASYVMVGTEESMALSFGSACHGAGRAMSRHAAKKQSSGEKIRRELADQGIRVYCDSSRGLAEEAPFAYKDVDEVIKVVHGAGLVNKVARLKPVAVIKGD